MPTYDYACNACNHRFEAVQKITDTPLADCPECHQQTLRKLISATGIVFKGEGWHRPESKGGSRREESASPPACGTGSCPSCALD